MQLKKLDIFGFKSFPEPTDLHFHEGITAIVGPNGCGKSNIIDAIRWVMGETSAKGLRGDSMEDVIFAGSESRKGVNAAEVTLTLTHAEGHLPERFGALHEVSITRRLHRSGDSEYLINRTPCRLKDITELFMDTGVGRRAYSVVEQGRIDAILSAKPQERRSLIEEAAGITKYKSRREEASRKMAETAQNLARLGDVIGEVRREMNALKRQAARAEEFKALRSERRLLERHLLVSAWQILDRSLIEARGCEEAASDRATRARVEADQRSASLEGVRLALLEQERELEKVQRQTYHTRSEISHRENRVAFLRREAAQLAERSTVAESEAGELGGRLGGLSDEIEALVSELSTVEQRLNASGERDRELTVAHAAAAARLAEAEEGVDRHRSAVLGILGNLTRANHGLDHAMRQEADGRRRREGMGRQEAELAAKLTEIDQEMGCREAELASAEETRRLALRARTDAEAGVKDSRARRQLLAAQVEHARKELHTDQSRLMGLEQIKESLEWYGAGVKAILREARQTGRNGVKGVVADAITAPAEYETALEAALGERLQYVIVESPRRGADAVRQLKSQRAGRSSFAPIELRPAAPPVFPSLAEAGALGCLLDLVEVAPAYQRLAECLLGDVFVVESLDAALGLWQKNGIRATLVTLEGEAVSPEGVITGGVGKQDGGGLLRKNREIRELRASVEVRRGELSGLETSLAEVDLEIEILEGRLETAREEVHRQELQVAHVGRDLSQLRERRDRLHERREAMEFEREELDARLGQIGDEVSRLEAEKSRLLTAHEEAEDAWSSLQAGLDRARREVEDAQGRLAEVRIEEASDRQRREGLSERLRILRMSHENVSRRIQKLGQEIREARSGHGERLQETLEVARELEVLGRDLVASEASLSTLVQELERRRGELTADEKAAAQARRYADDLQRELGDAQMAVRDLKLRADSVCERFRERQQADVEAEAASGVPTAFDASQAEARIQELDSQIGAFGEINLLAIDEYEDRKARYAFLEGQRRDLEESLESLRQAIQRINRVSRERFAETFEKVSRTFEELYPKMFRGGEARLLLTDPEDLLETGVDIVARPPGKKPQHISLLSGGEKALTAAALIFSIFLVKPSPFCILDEVDAPLDEANIGRFTGMIREMSASSQFLVITHNKSTMEGADHLYGITMSEPGVSKVVSVRLCAEEPPAKAA